MKLNSVLAFVFALFAVPSSFAQNVTWTCEARGQVYAGPGGPVWEYIRGQGATQQGAATNALNQCRRRGMQLCTIQTCYRR